MPPVGFELTISAGERLQTCTLDRATTGTGKTLMVPIENVIILNETFSVNKVFYPEILC